MYNVDPEHAQAYARQHGVSYREAQLAISDYQDKLERLTDAGWSKQEADGFLFAWDELPTHEMIDLELGLNEEDEELEELEELEVELPLAA